MIGFVTATSLPRRLYLAFCLLGTALIAQALAPLDLDELTRQLSALPVSVGENRTITRGRRDTLVSIGVREYVGHDHLARANPRGITRTLLIPGRHAAPQLEGDGLVLNLPALMLFRWQDGAVAARYPVSVGMVASRWHSPTGLLRVVSKAKNPAWRRPAWAGGGVQPAGATNPLGDRWIGLSRKGYGIHGTSVPSSIGRAVSHGCFRMYPAHVRELFDAVQVGQPVMLVYETVMVGHEHGIVYLSVYRDIYARGTNTLDAATARLNALGVAQAVPAEQLAVWLRQADGVARPILGSTIPVTVQGVSMATPVGPTVRAGTSYLPVAALAGALGAEATWDEATRTVTLTRRGRAVKLLMDRAEGFIALGTAFASARAAVEGLGGTLTYDAERGIAITF